MHGIAGDEPAVRCLVAKRVEIFGLAGEQADYGPVLEEAALVPLADELGQVAAEGDIVNCLGLGGFQRAHGRAGVDLEQRRPLLLDELHLRIEPRQLLLEGGNRVGAVSIVRGDRHPTGRLELRRLLGEHGRLHVGRWPQAEGVLVAFRPDDGIGQRLGSEEEHLLLLGEVADGEADIGEKRAEKHRHVVLGDHFLGDAKRSCGLAQVVTARHLELAALDAAARIDLLDGKLPAFLVGLGESRHAGIGVDLAELDRSLLGIGGKPRTRCERRCSQ